MVPLCGFASTGLLRLGKAAPCSLLPPVSSAADAAKAAAALLEAVAIGDLTPSEASELGKLIEAYVKALEATDFAERLTKLERMTNR